MSVNVQYHNRRKPIPGVTGKRVPGSARLPAPRNLGGFKTNVPYIPKPGGSSAFREYHHQQVRDVNGRFAGGWGFAWLGLHDVSSNVDGFIRERGRSWQDAAEKLAEEMVAWAKDNAPWTDDTGAARSGLQATVVRQGTGSFTIFLGHGKDIHYGIWLEVRWGGKYAIILPTIHHFAPRIGNRIATAT